MRLEEMYYLIEISRADSLHQASQRMFITPQALSKSIKKLENELGFKILNRSSQGVSMTEDGQKLLDLSLSFINGLESIQKSTQQLPKSVNGHITLLVTEGCLNSFFPPFISWLYKTYPGIDLRLVEARDYDIMSALTKQEYHLGVLTQSCVDNTCLESQSNEHLYFSTLLDLNYVMLVGKKSPLSQIKEITFAEFLSHRPIMLSSSIEAWNTLTNYMNLQPNFLEVQHFHIYTSAIENNLEIGVGTEMPTSGILIPPNINAHAIPIKEDLKCLISMVSNRETKLTEVEKFFVEVAQYFFRRFDKISRHA